MTNESMRERFEAWLTTLNSDPMYWNTYDAMFSAFQAATLAERERAAKMCDVYSSKMWALYKGRSPYKGDEPERASDLIQGQASVLMIAPKPSGKASDEKLHTL